MEIGILSPCCQPPAICPCHAENDSNRHLTTLFIYVMSQYYFSILALVSKWSRSFNTSTKTLWACAFLFSHMIYTFLAHHILRDLIWPDLLRRKNPTFLTIQFYTAPSHFLSLRSKHSPQLAGIFILHSIRNTKLQKYIWRAANIIYFYRAFILKFLDIRREETRLWTYRNNYTSFF